MRTAPRPTYRARDTPVAASSEEGGRDAGVDRHVQARRVAEVRAGDRGDRVRDVLRQHLALQDRALRVELPELLLRDAVGLRPVRAPARGEDAGAAHDAVG